MSALNPLPPDIVLAIQDENLRVRVQQYLDGLGSVHASEHESNVEHCELIVTDAAESVADLCDGEMSPGIILIGEGRADVVLPTEVTQRELVNSCRLLAEIVRLRRASREADRDWHALQQLALTDPLTELANRRGWEEAVREGARCVALVDLDHFARINETDGHPAGDDVLRKCGEALRRNAATADFVARVGGDEFAVLLNVIDRDTARSTCEELREQLAARLAADTPYLITASIGCCWSAELEADVQRLYARASDALKHAKASGRDRTVMA